MRLALPLALLLAAPLTAQEAPQVGPVIDRLSDRLPAIRDHLDALDTAPEGTTAFVRDRADIQNDLDRILDEIIALIVGPEFNDTRRRLFALDDRIDAAELATEELRIVRLTAPASPPELGLVDRALGRSFAPGSREAIDADLLIASEEMTRLLTERNAIISDFRARLRASYGIELTHDQALSILYQINGSSIAEAAITLSVLQQIEQRLAQIRETTANEDILRRYYGLAAALRLVTARLHERHLAQYEQDWLPAVEGLDADQQQLLAETEMAMNADPDPGREEAYRNNLGIQRSVADVITAYRSLLTDRQQIVQDRLTEAELDAALAINTLRTLENAVTLYSQFSWNSEEFRSLMGIDNSNLIPLDDEAMSENFLDLSRQMLGS